MNLNREFYGRVARRVAAILPVAAIVLSLSAVSNGVTAATKVKYAEVVRSVFYLPKYIAIANGYFAEQGIATDNGPSLANIVTVQAERVKTLKEMAAQSRMFFEGYDELDPGAAQKHLRPVAAEPLRLMKQKLQSAQDWAPDCTIWLRTRSVTFVFAATLLKR